MTKQEIKELFNSPAITGTTHYREIIETHISWVILTDNFAYKFKKPLHLHFLDFSTLEARKESCEKEYILNNRLAKEIYLGVLPIKKQADTWIIGEEEGEIHDYAVWMKRVDRETEMQLMIRKGAVTTDHIVQLAEQVATFHLSAEIIKPGWDAAELKNEFNDLSSVCDFVVENLGEKYGDLINEAITISDVFLDRKWPEIQVRIEKGYIRDVHGDLHAGNIFLAEKPIIFDCIEFNDLFRQIDVLNEIAFFCMDMEVHERDDLSELFLEEYTSRMEALDQAFEPELFEYYKSYRANVRAKVKALAAMQAEGEQVQLLLQEVKDYLLLMRRYLANL